MRELCLGDAERIYKDNFEKFKDEDARRIGALIDLSMETDADRSDAHQYVADAFTSAALAHMAMLGVKIEEYI